MTSPTRQAPRRGSGPAGFLARSAGCLGAAVLLCVLVAAGLLVWFFQTVHDSGREREHDARADVTAAAERLRTRLQAADADGTLTDREITDVLHPRSPRSVARTATGTTVVIQVAASDWAQCYAYTATRTGTVTSRPLGTCPSPSPVP
ncbi:hypothetical protein [Streptomyces cylindrosporus]|uniref:Uncharacterized protein n=1 Tax=Streptomyces cylindrosporus TaxID=2927583 RepID=A0ABS9Y3A6_9ACTN|nr:hypothetical protein [Streptomyces cylindrosporus]MCI3271701.1 hypothetical protein [Streptomyces cylindrosporus]